MAHEDSEWEDYGIVTLVQIHPPPSALDLRALGRSKGAASLKEHDAPVTAAHTLLFILA